MVSCSCQVYSASALWFSDSTALIPAICCSRDGLCSGKANHTAIAQTRQEVINQISRAFIGRAIICLPAGPGNQAQTEKRLLGLGSLQSSSGDLWIQIEPPGRPIRSRSPTLPELGKELRPRRLGEP